jgi:hypothetical protein
MFGIEISRDLPKWDMVKWSFFDLLDCTFHRVPPCLGFWYRPLSIASDLMIICSLGFLDVYWETIYLRRELNVRTKKK